MCELSIYMAGKVKDCMDSTSGGAPKFNHWYVLNLIKTSYAWAGNTENYMDQIKKEWIFRRPSWTHSRIST
jgi:hypothetical protein